LDLPMEKALDHSVSSLWSRLGRKPNLEDLDVSVVKTAGLQLDPALGEEVDRNFTYSSALRRSRLMLAIVRRVSSPYSSQSPGRRWGPVLDRKPAGRRGTRK